MAYRSGPALLTVFDVFGWSSSNELGPEPSVSMCAVEDQVESRRRDPEGCQNLDSRPDQGIGTIRRPC
jgi:hypothetical protein